MTQVTSIAALTKAGDKGRTQEDHLNVLESKSPATRSNNVEPLAPSARLLQAALSGLLACGAGACGADGDSDAYLLPGSNRTAQNWLDRPAREQELLTAFGARGLLPGGTAYQNMGEYHSVLSRAETERVVAYIRTLKPYIHSIKTVDK